MTRRRTLFADDSVVREVLILVAGILIAFGLDAWWAGRVERAEVHAELRSVQSELDANRGLVDQYIGWHERAAAATTQFLALLTEQPTRSVDVPDLVIWGVGFTPSFDPRTGAIDALLGSGRLAAIDDPALRRGLAGFGGYLTDARDEEMRAREFADQQLLSVLYRSGDIARVVGASYRDEVPPGVADQTIPIENSVALRNHLARRLLFAELSVESLVGVRDQIDELAAMIRRVVGE